MDTPKSDLFAIFRAEWPEKPYPLVVDHLDAPRGRVCPAASLYNLGRMVGEQLKSVPVDPGEVVACFPRTWIEWIGMLQGCLRRGAVFAPARLGLDLPAEVWVEAVGAGVVLDGEGARRLGPGRRASAPSVLVGPPAILITEAELLAATEPGSVDPWLRAEGPVWLDDRLAPLAETLAVVALLRTKAELHLGATLDQAMALADDDHRLFAGNGVSSSMASVRGWAAAAG